MFRAINKIIKTLMVSDLFLNMGWGLLSPIFAIFVLRDIVHGDASKAAEVAGTSALIFWVLKSFLQIPISRFLDKQYGEKDDFWFMVFGLFIMGIVPFGYLVSTSILNIYSFQILYAIGTSMYVPAWYAIFTRHIDKGKEAFEWGMDSTFLGIGFGIAGWLGGTIVFLLGFKAVFVITGVLDFFSVIVLLTIYRNVFPRDEIFPQFFPFRKN